MRPAAHVSDLDHSVHHAEQSDDLAENLHVIYDNRLHGVILRLKAVMTVFLVKTLNRSRVVHQRNDDLSVFCGICLFHDDPVTVEDTGIVLGQAFARALQDKAGITRFADVCIPMDETLVQAAVDISGRGQAYCDLPVPTQRVGSFDTELAVEFFYAFARDAGVTLHVRELAGENSHHIIEAAFKAAGRAMRFACELDPRVVGIPSTKGSL